VRTTKTPTNALVDHLGRPFASTTGYIASGSSRRSMRGWNPIIRSADAEINPKLETLRASSRDLWANTPLATAALKRFRTNVVGYGLRLQSRIDYRFLGLSETQAEDWQRKTEREFALWAGSAFCDASRANCFEELQSLAYFSQLLSGDVFVMLPYKQQRGWPYQLCVKLVEADLVSNPWLSQDTDKISGGVECDLDGAPIAYHVRKGHPGDSLPTIRSYQWQRVPVYGPKSGRRQVLHLFKKDRPGQKRGIPEIAPVIEPIKQLGRYSDSELMAALVTSFYTVFIKTTTPTGSSPLSDSFVASEKVTSSSNSSDANVYELGNGSVVELGENEGIEIADPKRPNKAFDSFFLAVVTLMGAALEIPREVLLQTFTASYSASRAAMLQAWKTFLTERIRVKRNFCDPIYQDWLSHAISIGRILAPGFFDDPVIAAAWSSAEWNGPGMGQLNPEVETKAAIERINAGLSTYSKETAAIDGDDWDSMVDRLGREKRIMKEYGLEISEESSSMSKPVSSDDSTTKPDKPDKPENDEDTEDEDRE
jgi:lambda family phage portal protein